MKRDLLKLFWSLVIIAALVIGFNMLSGTINNKVLASNENSNSNNAKEVEDNENENNSIESNEAEINDDNIIEILSLGNIIIHDKQLEGAEIENGYDFSPSFKYIKNMISDADISLGILETVFAGGTPKGYPLFNTPDVFLDDIKECGVDIVNYANNHILDGQADGFFRTLQVTKEKNIDILGVVENRDEKNYLIKEVKGTKIGFISYGFETEKKNGKRAINAIKIPESVTGLINTFNYNELDKFYENIQNQINSMKEDGAKFIITSMHWGEEYETTQNQTQINIANKLNELGVDIILGGHPHVIQPYEVIKNDIGHETLVIYSQGNTLSNQCEEEIGISESEDGILVDLKLQVIDGEVSLKEYTIIPTWVNREENEFGKFAHTIIPVEDAINNEDKYNMSQEIYLKLKSSLQRTNNIINPQSN